MIIICAIIKNENSRLALLRFMYASIVFIIIRLIASNPLNPSIRLAPLITNKRHKSTNMDEKKWLLIIKFKNEISILKIFIGKTYIKEKSKKIIISNLLKGFIFTFKSSKKPMINIERLIKMYSVKITE